MAVAKKSTLSTSRPGTHAREQKADMAGSYRERRAKVYKGCTNVELIGFLAAKAGIKISRGRKKAYYIDRLAKVDEAATFRFLDLPPELRNLVYKELLILDQDRHGFPEILATCKQVHDEGDGILYRENRFCLEVDVVRRKVDPDFRVRLDTFVDFMSAGPRSQLFATRLSFINVPKRWPSQLTKIRDLEVWFTCRRRCSLQTLNHYLYRFCSFLASSNSLHQVYFTISDDLWRAHYAEEGLLRAFWPLSKLVNPIDFQAISWTSRNPRLNGAPLRGGGSTGYDAVARYEALMMQVRTLKVTKGTSIAWNAWSKVLNANARLYKWRSYDGYMDEKADKEFTKEVKELEKAMEHEAIKDLLAAAASGEKTV